MVSNVLQVNFYNFAFAGPAKRGKSSLINALRGLKKNDEGAARVDFTECTDDVTFYTFPDDKMPFVRLYDVPGSGTLSHGSENYYRSAFACSPVSTLHSHWLLASEFCHPELPEAHYRLSNRRFTFILMIRNRLFSRSDM
jgi:hypothetical protein